MADLGDIGILGLDTYAALEGEFPVGDYLTLTREIETPEITRRVSSMQNEDGTYFVQLLTISYKTVDPSSTSVYYQPPTSIDLSLVPIATYAIGLDFSDADRFKLSPRIKLRGSFGGLR